MRGAGREDGYRGRDDMTSGDYMEWHEGGIDEPVDAPTHRPLQEPCSAGWAGRTASR